MTINSRQNAIKIAKLYEKGHTIKINTSDICKALMIILLNLKSIKTLTQLNKWGLKYHKLLLINPVQIFISMIRLY